MNHIKPGQLVYYRNTPGIVLELKGLTELVFRDNETNEVDIARVSEVSLSPVSEDAQKANHILVNDENWDAAVTKYELIKPLLDMPNRQEVDVLAVANAADKSVQTIYRWIRQFEETETVSSLLRAGRSDKNKSRLDDEAEAIIARNIEKYYLVKERPTLVSLYRNVHIDCVDAGIPVPHKNTIKDRVQDIDERKRISARYSPKIAKEKKQPLRGSFPGADYPNAVVQIDHTPVDVIIVDRVNRLPIGRPFLTIAFEVLTKMISGFYLSLDPPSASTAGLCVASAVLGKEQWLAKRNIDAEWPIYGKMAKIHVDNAAEFRGKMLRRACTEHDIVLEFRPKGMPNYGPHVERAFRTFMSEHQRLPGTTFSNVSKKLDYDSEGKACFTLDELEEWFTVFLVYCYHHQAHRGINDVPPIKMYHKYVHGAHDHVGIGLPAPIQDEAKFRLDFTPYEERSIQRDGVVIDYVRYYSDVLQQYIAVTDPTNKGKTKKYIFARDPRDISKIYFLDPETKTYTPIPYLDNTRPAISLWELKAAVKIIKDDPMLQADEETIFKGIRRMRELEAEAIERTRLSRQSRATEKRKRRAAERREDWQEVQQAPIENLVAETVDSDMNSDFDTSDIEPFSDIQVG